MCEVLRSKFRGSWHLDLGGSKKNTETGLEPAMFEWPVPVSWRSQQENRDTGLDKTSGHGCSDSKSQSHICCSWRVYGRRRARSGAVNKHD